MSSITELEELIATTADRAGPAVVGLGRGWGRGTGVVIGEGRVLTCAHAIGEDAPAVRFAGDDTPRAATVLGSDPVLDLAVLEVDTRETTPLTFVDAADAAPCIGQNVLALGNPGGRGLRVTAGHISALAQRMRGPRGRRGAMALEHTAPLPRGSSGGPLLDRDGRLLGINSVRTDGGLILAIHLDAAVRETVAGLARGEAPRRATLGVAVIPPRAARELRGAVGLPEREGLLVHAVQDGGPAASAGVRRGDLIVRLGDRPVTGIGALHAALEATGESPFELGLVRGSDDLALEVVLGGGER